MKTTRLSGNKATFLLAIACIAIGTMFWSADNAFSGDQAQPANLSPGLQEVVKLSQAQMGDDVILAYIKNSGASYSLSADDILYLKSQGVSQGVISALLQTKSAVEPSPPGPENNAAPQPSASAEPPPLDSGSPIPPPASPAVNNPPPSPPQESAPPVSVPPSESAPLAASPVSFQMPANVPWFDSGIDLFTGEAIAITAGGVAKYDPWRPYVTPAGMPVPWDRRFLAPGLPAYSLIGKITQFGMPFEIGMGTSFAAPVGGRLYLSMNDWANAFGDNSGSWDVTVGLPVTGQVTPPVEVNLDYFRDQLTPYGAWVDVPGYGQCWQPSVVFGWRPYYDAGHWVYTDAGWYWQSDYAWGGIPFHYGRWVYEPGYNWVWMPGYEYAPAWVFWRHAEGYCGWAPLPPGAALVGGAWEFRGRRVPVDFDFGLSAGFFTFVDYNHFGEHDYRRFVVPRERVTAIYRSSTVINNYRVVNNRIVNEGVPRERIERATGRKIEVMRSEEIRRPLPLPRPNRGEVPAPARQHEEQRTVLQAHQSARQAEEANARQQPHQQEVPPKVQQSAFQVSGSSLMASAASNRGAASRASAAMNPVAHPPVVHEEEKKHPEKKP